MSNFSRYQLSEYEKSFSSKGLNVAISPKNLNYANYMLSFELLFRDIDLLDIQGRLRDFAFTSYRDAGKNAGKSLSKDEQFVLSTLIKNKDLVIQKAYKVNTVVILNKKDYNLLMKKILSDISKFYKLSIDQKKVLHHIVNMENIIISVLKKLKDKNQISDNKYKALHPVGSRPSILYGCVKIHKPIGLHIRWCSPFLSNFYRYWYTYIHNSEFFVLLLPPLTSYEYTIKDSFSFSEELLTFDCNLVMQVLCFHEKIWLDNCPVEFKPVIYRRFVDDTFLLFRSKEHIEMFRLYVNCHHPNIKFTSEIEENNSISFLDFKINRDNDRFLTCVYRKPTFSGVFTNFDSLIP